MIRFIKNILDIKNLLGMQRVVPPTPPEPYPANEIVLRTNGNTVTFTPVFTGSITVRYTYNGTNTEVTYGNVWSGQQMSSYSDYGTDFIIIGNVTQIEVGADVEFLSYGNTIDYLYLYVVDSPNLRILDLRNLVSISSYAISYACNINTIYANATTSEIKDFTVSAINGSPDGGVLWIDRTQTYAADVIAAAQAHNWTIYDL